MRGKKKKTFSGRGLEEELSWLESMEATAALKEGEFVVRHFFKWVWMNGGKDNEGDLSEAPY